MKTIKYSILIILMAACHNKSEPANVELSKAGTLTVTAKKTNNPTFFVKHTLLSLMKKTPVEIGCMLQTDLDYKDTVFNCDNKNYVNKGDPCKNVKEYYEGVEISDALSHKIDPIFKSIKLDFEHGGLRQVSITFTDSILIEKVQTMFKLPSDKTKLPSNVIDIEYGENVYSKDKPVNPNYTRWLSVTAFDHIGAGEVKCP